MTLYFDYAATTPVDAAVTEAMATVLRDPALQANPSSSHGPGLAARACVDAARADIAALIGADPTEIVLTSGATEANNLAVLGAARWCALRGRHLVTSVMEHASVTAPFRQLEREGYRVTWLQPDADGRITADALAAALQSDTTLVSLQHVNNETGVRHDIASFGAICRARNVLLHVDAVQAAGRELIDVRRQSVDLLSLSAHKMYGPKGAGALFLDARRVPRVQPVLHGGGQERGLRPGTVATHQAHGMGIAARMALTAITDEPARIAALRERLWQAIGTVPGVLLNGHRSERACHILNVSVTGVDGESLQFALRGLAVSSGAACDAVSDEPSAVLRSLGRAPDLARSSVRFSLGRSTTAADVDAAAACFTDAVAHLRRIAPRPA